MVGHKDRGVEALGLQAGEKTPIHFARKMSVVVASVFACPGTGCFRRPSRRRCCEATARTPDTCGTSRSSSTGIGGRAGPARQAIWSSAGSLPRRGRQWDVRRLSRKTGEVWVPKAGWVRFRWSRAVPDGVKSYRVIWDRAGRWHVAFAAVPAPVTAPGNGQPSSGAPPADTLAAQT
jgi:hypothetical protein